MNLKLKLDYEGNPYLELLSKQENLEDEALELFIREARKNGIYLKNEADMESRDDYASIRFNLTKK